MLELLKKLGLPATVAAIVSAMVTVVPFLFKIDGRYAKAEELTTAIQKLETKQTALTTEISKLAGTTEVLVALASQKTDEATTIQVKPRTRFSTSVDAGNNPPSSAGGSVPAPVAAPPASAPKIAVEHVDVPQAPKAGATTAEKKETLQQVQRALEASRRNLEQIQKY
jgi:hypothetical protein